jgi:CheY-like chemotaxis protein
MSNNEPILIIDDSLNDAEFAKIILKESGEENIIHATSLGDAVTLLKRGDIKRVVLDLGGLVKGSSNPMATLDALEKEGIRDLQVVVLTGNKNPTVREEVEKRGYQCLTKDRALDLVESSTMLPDAIARLPPSYHADLKQDIYIKELFLINQSLESRIKRLESQFDQLLLSRTHNSGSDEVLLKMQYLETKITHIELMRNHIGEVSIKQDFFQQQITEIKSSSSNHIVTIETLLKDVKHLMGLAEEHKWLIIFSRYIKKVILFFAQKIKELVLKYIGVLITGFLLTALASASIWFPALKENPRLQQFVKWAIENVTE